MLANRSIFFLQDKMQFEDILAFKSYEVAGVELQGIEKLDGEVSRLEPKKWAKKKGGGARAEVDKPVKEQKL
jgi:hypothetical protein